jgi:hypothetical protein
LQIFLSYASEDKDVAEPIAFSLRARGHKVFFDRDDLPPGAEYDVRIEKAVERSALFIFLISQTSIEKGRFTLTELEFARRKWRDADGHVLPVLVKATPLASIPNFLKSVTILEPAGNIAAEVASAVDPLSQRLATGQMLFYGGLAMISGLLTWLLFFNLGPYLDKFGMNLSLLRAVGLGSGAFATQVDLAQELSGLPFAVVLCVSFAYYLKFRARQLIMIIFVLVGWFVAVQIVMSFGATAQNIAINPECLDLKGVTQGAKDETLISQCAEYWRNRFEQSENIVSDLIVWFIAGAVGALSVAIGTPLATRRLFSPLSVAITTFLGAVVAMGWYGITWWINPNSFDPYPYLFMTWQPVVAGAIGRSLR